MGEGWGYFLATTIRSVKGGVSDAKLAEDGLGELREYFTKLGPLTGRVASATSHTAR